jgi:hypothetical protein
MDVFFISVVIVFLSYIDHVKDDKSLYQVIKKVPLESTYR